MTSSNPMNDLLLRKLSKSYELSPLLLSEYLKLFQEHSIPTVQKPVKPKAARKIVMVSTHGYWGNPPPTGFPDTGGQTYYVLEVSKAWAKLGRQVIIIARWFEPFPKVEQYEDNLWLIRIPSGSNRFVRKEDIYPLVPDMAETATAISALFGANAVVGHYADGMAAAIEIGERLEIPAITIPHSTGIRKMETLGMDPSDPESWFGHDYNFWTREGFELASLQGTNLEIANTPREPLALKKYYNCEFPSVIMPAGAGSEFFQAFNDVHDPIILSEHGILPKQYLIFYGRFSTTKNPEGTVAVLGHLREMEPKLTKDIKLVIAGGSQREPLPEEKLIEHRIQKEIEHHNLTDKDVIRIYGHLDRTVLTALLHNSLFYIGMQVMEPFGMAVAEAIAAGAPAVISGAAGITKWMKDGYHAIVVDPHDPKEAAARIIETLKNKKLIDKLIKHGRELAKENFSWDGIAKKQASLMDQLCRNELPKITNNDKASEQAMLRRRGRGYHRMLFSWRGDPPKIKEIHKHTSEKLGPFIAKVVEEKKKSDQRAIISISGESGSGKTEIAIFLRYLLRKYGIRSLVLPGDVFFKLPPSKNYEARLRAYKAKRLEGYVGPGEIDLRRLDSILSKAVSKKCTKIFTPSDCRKISGRQYKNVPVDLANIDAIFIDLTFGITLKHPDLKIFLESPFTERIEQIRKRNLERDPNQDFKFISKVLEIEHKKLTELSDQANIIVGKDYQTVRFNKGGGHSKSVKGEKI